MTFNVGDRVTYTGDYEFYSQDSMIGMTGTVTRETNGVLSVFWDDKPTNPSRPSTSVYDSNVALIDPATSNDLFDQFTDLVRKMRGKGYTVEAKVTKPSETVEV